MTAMTTRVKRDSTMSDLDEQRTYETVLATRVKRDSIHQNYKICSDGSEGGQHIEEPGEIYSDENEAEQGYMGFVMDEAALNRFSLSIFFTLTNSHSSNCFICIYRPINNSICT